MRHSLLLSVSFLALAVADTAQAAAPDTTIETVVVTAERRTTDLQRTAIAATVLSGAELVQRGVTNVDQLQSVAPSLTVQNFGQGNDFNIRGIGKGEQNSGTLVGVVTYRDGVATFPGYFQDEPYYDIASLEVLRGPQGTFAGQNATGGAVFITEVNPDLNKGFTGYLQGQVGNYGDEGVQGAVNIPVDDTFALRVAFNEERRDSFYDIKTPYPGNPGDLQSYSGRISALWQPTSQFKVLFKTDFNYIDTGGLPADPVDNPFNPGHPNPEDPFHITANAPQTYFDRFMRSVLDISYEFDNGITLRSVSGYQNGRTGYSADLDGTNLAGVTFSDAGAEEIFSQEFNLVSPDSGPLTWVAGVYYSYDRLYFPYPEFHIHIPGTGDEYLTGVNPKQTAAVFGQVSYALTDALQLQVGARYSDFRTTNDAQEIVDLGFFKFPVPFKQTEHDGRLTGKVALNWTIDQDNFVYAFVATGHKGGGLNTPALVPGAPLPPKFKPEDVTDYELGWKSSFFDQHLTTQLGGFYNDYKNFQVSIGNPTDPANSTELNVPSRSTIYGMEAEAQGTFGGFSFNAGVSLLHSRIGRFYAADPRALTLAACSPLSGPAGGGCVNITGNQQVYAPTFTFNVGAQYVFDLDDGDTLTPRANFGHIAPQYATLFENIGAGDLLSARDLLGAQLSYQTGDWDFTAYGTNLTDQHYISAINSGLRFMGAPRQYGIRLTKAF